MQVREGEFSQDEADRDVCDLNLTHGPMIRGNTGLGRFFFCVQEALEVADAGGVAKFAERVRAKAGG